MPSTLKHRKVNNRTKKNKHSLALCPIGLEPFEAEFSKNLSKKNLKANQVRKAEFARQLLKKYLPNSINPQNDFYDYINYTWLKDVTVKQTQKYIVQVDDFRLTQDKVYHELDAIILDYIKNNKNSLSKNLKLFYDSVVSMNPKSYSRKLASNAVEIVENLIKENNPWKLLAFFNSDEMISSDAPFVWTLEPDQKDVKTFRCNVSPHHFSLVDLAVYFDDGTEVAYKKKYRQGFFNGIRNVFKVSLGKNHYNPKDVLDVEMQLINAFNCPGIKVSSSISYNKIYADESLSKYGFDWCEFSKNLGFKKAPHFFLTSDLSYFKCATKIFLENWNTPKWKTYWINILLKQIVRLTSDWKDIIYKFSGKMERGQSEINKSESVTASLYMSIPFNTFLTNEYCKHYENPRYIEYLKILCEDFKLVFKRILTYNNWLQPSTKKYALKKLEHFQFIYGKPEKLREDPLLNYGKYLYDNMKKIHNWRHKMFIELEGKAVIDIPLMDWTQYPVKMIGTQAYIVNASYTPTKNSIYINMGYIQKPFIDLDERGIEYNLAHFGDTIGHEMSHGFDDVGSQYGWDGNLYDWWTPEDKKKYKSIQEDVIKQYESYALRDGIKFDASIGIGEDLADISGLAICDEYLRNFQTKNSDLLPLRHLSYDTFYTYYAFQQRQKVSKKALTAQLKTNPHPLDKYRCNVPLSRSKIFRALYNVKEKDGMWWHNSNTIW
jgi:predicted metalloendopeptidase